MKKIRTFLLKKTNSLISIFLSLLGFGAVCSLGGCEHFGAMEYGTPHAIFKVKGTVKSEATSEAIPNIRVVMDYDTAYTDASGNYLVGVDRFPSDQTFHVQFTDIDGAANGEYDSLGVAVEFVDPEFTGGSGSWDNGEIEKVINVNLKEKE